MSKGPVTEYQRELADWHKRKLEVRIAHGREPRFIYDGRGARIAKKRREADAEEWIKRLRKRKAK